MRKKEGKRRPSLSQYVYLSVRFVLSVPRFGGGFLEWDNGGGRRGKSERGGESRTEKKKKKKKKKQEKEKEKEEKEKRDKKKIHSTLPAMMLQDVMSMKPEEREIDPFGDG
ncbi:hypothetical protein BZA05DRAFT_436055 [Tricharina praecox]|uniref:uncharacterized protein n=1 Tax=Tricharina praecox TaxID=43433 RepID=UPI00221F8CFE|nr:uncharacterized protein BZA05DRAFT_436055 [Tricharina praecox]KAI5852173.1 hypothetical protein BZA05DRAFT_436055 [Tricharina praecox]